MENTELMHYGVKGMKWGVRRKQIRNASSDRNIRQTQTRRSANKMMYDAKNRAAEATYYGERSKVRDNFINRSLDKYDSKMLTRAKARNKVDYDLTELNDRFNIEKQKARKDKSHKQSAQYKDARKALGRATVERFMLGNEGYIRVHTDMNAGKSEAEARGREMVLQILSRMA